MITMTDIDNLRREIGTRLGQKRFSHVLGVERCAARLGQMYLPDRVLELRAAALLHDVAKEIPYDDQRDILTAANVILSEADQKTPALFHAFAGPTVIKRDFPEFATPDILDAVFYHTTGRPGMGTFEKIILISDFIEDTRAFPACIRTRDEFDRAALLDGATEELLTRTALATLDRKLEVILKRGGYISERTVTTRNALIEEITTGK